jgi:hypothetical protein
MLRISCKLSAGCPRDRQRQRVQHAHPRLQPGGDRTERLGLDDPANDQLRAVRLAHDAVTVLFDEDLRTGIAHAEYLVAVEVDQVDVEARVGWFVLVRGAAHHLDTEAERAPFIDAGLGPWVEGVPAHFIRVSPTSIWGNGTRRA